MWQDHWHWHNAVLKINCYFSQSSIKNKQRKEIKWNETEYQVRRDKKYKIHWEENKHQNQMRTGTATKRICICKLSLYFEKTLLYQIATKYIYEEQMKYTFRRHLEINWIL